MTVQCPSQTTAFQNLSRIFSTRDDSILEIEILPPALGPFLHDEGSIGLTKKHLVEAFVTARQVFFENLKHAPQIDGPVSQIAVSQNHAANKRDKDLAIASEIILLFDCEHLTACNWRKKRLAALPSSGENMDRLEHALTTELSLMTTYLCSPLHRHTKSPTLWQHRLWVLTRLLQLRKPRLQEVQKLLSDELAVVLRAGELHPRNYYAFSHVRQVHCVLSDIGGETEARSALLAGGLLESTIGWCLAHPADISGWTFTFYLLEAVPNSAICFDAVSKVAVFALDIGWEGESLWTFVDMVVTSLGLASHAGDNAQKFPWNVLLTSAPVQTSVWATGGPKQPWKRWRDTARVYWASTERCMKENNAA